MIKTHGIFSSKIKGKSGAFLHRIRKLSGDILKNPEKYQKVIKSV
jgi:hypothetical protein